MNKEIIIALDDPNNTNIIDKLGELIKWYKVGPICYLHHGEKIIKELKNKGKSIMLDLKFHDIPNTVYNSCLEARNMGVDMLTIHLSGGSEMIDAAIKSEVNILGVSVLTSISQKILNEDLNIDDSIENRVGHLIDLGVKKNIYGVVCSPKDTKDIRDYYDNYVYYTKLKIVNPGIRLLEDSKDDQKRITTPKKAFEDGADYIVVGRSIINDDNPVAKCEKYINIMKGIK